MLSRARDDPSALEAILDEDITWEVGAMNILGVSGTYRGPRGVLTFFAEWMSPFSDWDYEFDELSEVGDRVVVHIHQWGTGRTSGARVENDFWQVWQMRDGKAVRGTNHLTREEALAAAEA